MQYSFFIYYFRFFLFLSLAATAAMVFISVNSQTANAAGFGVSPSSLEFTVEKGTEVSRQLIIYNTGRAAEFEAESSNLELVMVYPSSGIIDEGGTATITVTATGKTAGTKKEEINVRISGLSELSGNGDKEVGISLGAGIPVKVIVVNSASVAANAFVGVMLAMGIVLFGLAAYYASRKKIRQLRFAAA